VGNLQWGSSHEGDGRQSWKPEITGHNTNYSASTPTLRGRCAIGLKSDGWSAVAVAIRFAPAWHSRLLGAMTLQRASE